MASGSKCVLVTGTNSGLGLGICTRLIDDFLRASTPSTASSPPSLTLIFTTRSTRKGNETLQTIQAHLVAKHAPFQHARIHLRPEKVDLTDLLSVRALARKLVDDDNIPRLDTVILNAGLAGWSGIDWLDCFWTIMWDIRTATTWPRFKLGMAGLLTPKQFPEAPATAQTEPPLGQLFCANVFGHYMLVHWLMPLIRACEAQTPGRIVWVSSIEPQARHLDEDDIQGINSHAGYESTKRLVDTLALTYNQPLVAPSTATFIDPQPAGSSKKTEPQPTSTTGRPILSTPSMHTAHPGILTTTIIALPWMVFQAYYLGILLARVAGSVWATLDSYPAAQTMTWLTLAPMSEIDKEERKFSGSSTSSLSSSSSSSSSSAAANHGRVKWGTAGSRFGTTSVRPTEVEGWGVNGSGTSYATSWWAGKLGRVPGIKEATPENVQDFVALGQRLWRDMEQLRREWEERIEDYEVENAINPHKT